MKNNGLKNRFSQEVRQVWLYWFSCMVCGKNQADALHHIISPSSQQYQDCGLNDSVFNSCPIHNMKHPNAHHSEPNCHVGNEAHLYLDETIRYLLNEVAYTLLNMLEYEPNEDDLAFVKTYHHLYSDDILKQLGLL